MDKDITRGNVFCFVQEILSLRLNSRSEIKIYTFAVLPLFSMGVHQGVSSYEKERRVSEVWKQCWEHLDKGEET
jgi:hypothetical protein